jgi:hypothetical protein
MVDDSGDIGSWGSILTIVLFFLTSMSLNPPYLNLIMTGSPKTSSSFSRSASQSLVLS